MSSELLLIWDKMVHGYFPHALISALLPLSINFRIMRILLLLFSNLFIFPYYYNTLYTSKITHLPGFDGSLPFSLDTGYVTVNEESGAELFYYFVESERNPSDDPLILWLVGGPYCSGFVGLAFEIGDRLIIFYFFPNNSVLLVDFHFQKFFLTESIIYKTNPFMIYHLENLYLTFVNFGHVLMKETIPIAIINNRSKISSIFIDLYAGPLRFKVKAYDGTLPTLIPNPYSWTKISNIIFLDWPVGSGFSFSTSMVDYHTNDVQSTKQIYTFIIKWLLDHPSFQSNPFYVAGDSYGGKMTPLVALEITEGNEYSHQVFVNLKGYAVGNPLIGESIYVSPQVSYAHGLGIISDELLKLILINCLEEDYQNPKNALCRENLKTFNGFLSEINNDDILEPKCADDPPALKELDGSSRSLMKEKSLEFYCSLSIPDIDCTNGHLLSYYWSNDNLTKVALHIKEGTVEEWHRCKQDLTNYTFNIPSCVPHHLNLTSRGYRALVYSGDHDLDVPFISTLEWIRSLNFSVIDDWHSWHAGGQVAGYTMLFSNNLTFATVKGGSHTPPVDMPLQCFVMFERWISHKSL